MPAKKLRVKRTFILGQPLFRPSARRREARWHAVIDEREPRDDRRSEFTPTFNPHVEESAKEDHSFCRLNRDKLVAGLANLGDDSAKWRRVALICGAGLGKTTNLQWLAAAINRHAMYRGKQLAFFLELKDLTENAEDLLQKLLTDLHDTLDAPSLSAQQLRLELIRRRRQGRITLLFDSLDQAGSDSRGPAVRALQKLLSAKSVWQACPIWVSGRPSAFKDNRKLFLEEHRWTYLRVGQLDEPETRFLLEATREERRLRKK